MIVLGTHGPLAGLLATGLMMLASTVQAETTITRTQNALPGKAVRIVISPNLKKDCSTGPMPEIRIATAPKNGSVISRSGKLKTPAGYRCPNKDAQAQAVFYQSKSGFTGTDDVVVEVKTSEGTVERQDIRITVDGSKKDAPKDREKGATDL